MTLDRALLWTDSRYFIQAAAQLDGSGIELMKDGLAETPSIAAFLCSALPAGSRVGVDGMLLCLHLSLSPRLLQVISVTHSNQW